MAKKYYIVIVIAIIIFLGLFLYNKYVGKIISLEAPLKDEGINDQQKETPKSYTLEQVSSHSQENDCWIIIENKVYEVTQYIPFHPGGKAILKGCGKDATELFKNRPTNLKTPHPEEAFQKLNNYYIGEIQQ